MAKQVRIRRDTETNLLLVIPADGEGAFNTTKDRLHMGDGSTYGGMPHVTYKDLIEGYFDYVTAGGSANAITINLPYDLGGYGAGVGIKFKAASTNTTATTINIDGLGTKNIYKMTAGVLGALIAGDIVSGGIYEVVYDGTQFQLLGAGGGIVTVAQGDLETASQTFSAACATPASTSAWAVSTADTALSSGNYGFQIESSVQTADFGAAQAGGWILSRNNTSYGASVRAINFGNTNIRTIQGRQRYVTSSPPYEVNGEEAGGFIYILFDESGNFQGHSAGETPPWVFNGKTDTKCTHKCPITGKKFRRVREKRSIEEIMDGAEAVYNLEEITQDIKNADMGDIPHPFGGIPSNWTPVLLDYTDERLRRLVTAQTDGELDIGDLILNGYLKANSDEITNKGPQGVALHRLEFKYSGTKKKK